MTEPSSLVEDLKRLRDELHLQIHLGSKELQDEWAELEQKWDEFARNAELEKTAEGLGAAAKAMGDELQKAYERLRKALRS